MMPEARLPAMPIACAIRSGDEAERRRDTRRPQPARRSTAVGWKHALWIACGATRLMRHIISTTGGDALLTRRRRRARDAPRPRERQER